MNQVIFTRQRRSDGLLSAFGILFVFGLAAAFSVVGSQQGNLAAKAVPIGVSAILFALGIRGIFLHQQKSAYSFVVGSESIVFGWVHKPRRKRTIKIGEIVQIDWLSSEDDGRARVILNSGEEVWLPLHFVNVPKSELRSIVEEHFGHIESID